MNNGEKCQIYAADNRWHDAIYIGKTTYGSHVVEVDKSKSETAIHECAFVRKDEYAEMEETNG